MFGPVRSYTRHRGARFAGRLTLTLALIAAVGCSTERSPLEVAASGAEAEFRLPLPWPLPQPVNFVAITAGDSHTCALRSDGAVFCWGLNSSRQVGIPSIATCTDVNGGGGVECVDRPRRVSTNIFTSASTIDAGRNHVCALTPNGTPICWAIRSAARSETA